MSAIMSDYGLYRYRLERPSSGFGATGVIMVNPSLSKATENDHAIRKLMGFGDRNQWGRIIIGNLFAYRATDVRDLARVADPVGPQNDRNLLDICGEVDRIVCAWGPTSRQPRRWRARWRHVVDLVDRYGHRPFSIGPPALCGHPRHPLTLSYDLPILPWNAP